MSAQTELDRLFISLKKPQGKVGLYGLMGLARVHIALKLSEKKPLIYLTKSTEEAESALSNARFLLPQSEHHKLLYLPSLDKSPYQKSTPDPLLSMERTSTLFKLATSSDFRLLIAPLSSFCQKHLPFSALQDNCLTLEKDEDYEREPLLKNLHLWGYQQVLKVEDPGTYAVRGSIIDIFWQGLKHPLRLDFFGETLDRFFTFDAETQRLLENIPSVTIGPVKEIALTPEIVSSAKRSLRDLADEVEYPTLKLKEKLQDLGNGIPFFGIEALMPAFFEELETPLGLIEKAYSPESFALYLDDAQAGFTAAEALHESYDTHYEKAVLQNSLCFSPKNHLLDVEVLRSGFEKHLQINLSSGAFASLEESGDQIRIDCPSTHVIREKILHKSMETQHNSTPDSPHFLLAPLAHFLKSEQRKGNDIFLPVSTNAGLHRLRELLEPHGVQIQALKYTPDLLSFSKLPPKSASVHAFSFVAEPHPPKEGCQLSPFSICIIPEDDIFGAKTRRAGASGKKKGFQTSLADLNEGDAIVHVDHGIGLFLGLKKLHVRGVEQDYVLLSYQGEDKLYLPVHRINLIQPYSGVEAKVPRLDKLGGPGWHSKKKKVQDSVLAMAQDLLHLYAKRELAKRPKFSKPDELYYEFEAKFPFEETPDQQKAIDDILADMQKERPMDRLICGDVGYGKTEVAIRAAMLAVLSGKQVGILAPTTILAQQHGITFRKRFKGFTANIEIISRFQKPKDIRRTLERVKRGEVDILVGTHRLLSADVQFKDLGLVVVDEEQRFGIKAKEHLKKLRTHIDLLTMSATPIPRTLQMGFFGLRDLSVIETPPVDRRAIRTSIVQFDDAMIREAILRELSRGGQVYFVHNRVTTIEGTADYIRSLVPEANVRVGHGQMPEKELESVMIGFMKHEFNVLVCTTIIETGIDVPSANTMFVDHADDFGLSQLYQLRGRIGRSKERAFAYLMVKGSMETLTDVAKKRLEILHKFSELGAGFKIAQHDLELRGAGDLLGKTQHGHMAAVGYDMYASLLKEAVADLESGGHEDVPDPDVKLPIKALIPENYIVDLHERLGFYQKLATAQTEEDVWSVVGSMEDICGKAPEEVLNLAQIMLIKQLLRKIGAIEFTAHKPKSENDLPQISIGFGQHMKLNPSKLMAWVKERADRVSISPSDKLLIRPSEHEWEVLYKNGLVTFCKTIIVNLRNFSLIETIARL